MNSEVQILLALFSAFRYFHADVVGIHSKKLLHVQKMYVGILSVWKRLCGFIRMGITMNQVGHSSFALTLNIILRFLFK